MMRVYQATDIGVGRALNEDAVASLDHETYVIADGMGGYAAGEVASHILVETVRDILSSKVHFDETSLKEAILRANDAILQKVREHPSYTGMGTTATIFHRENDLFFWAHVGDSRLYLLREHSLKQITRDHSLVSDLVENGSITPDEARFNPKRNVITRAVGVATELMVDSGRFPATAGDVLLLCSDGLTSVLSDDVIYELLDTPRMNGNVAELLIKKALEKESHDNISALVVLYDI